MSEEINLNVRIAGQLKSDLEMAFRQLASTWERLEYMRNDIEKEQRNIITASTLLKDYFSLGYKVPDKFRDCVFAKIE
jgi:hypothetical protein